MKWIKLDGNKEPDFYKSILIYIQSGNAWHPAHLLEKKETTEGKTYAFARLDTSERLIVVNATHFMYIDPPKEQ